MVTAPRGDGLREIERSLRLLAPAAIDEPLPAFVGDRFMGVLYKRPDGKVDAWPASGGLSCGWQNYAAFQAAVKSGHWRQSWFSFDSTQSGAVVWSDYWTSFKGTYTGAANTARQFTDTTVGAIPVGGDTPGGQTKHITNLMATSNASINNNLYMFYDRVLAYEANAFTAGAPQAMTNTLPALRYTTGGLRCFATVQTVTGATASSWTAIPYSNPSAGASTIPLSTTPAIIQVSMTAPTATIAAVTTYGNTGFGPFFPLAGGDPGILSLTSYTTNNANTGTLALVLAHPFILWSPTFLKTAFSLDLSKQALLMDRVFDGCCLSMLGFTAAGSGGQQVGALDMAWS